MLVYQRVYTYTQGFLKMDDPQNPKNYGVQNVSILTWPNDLDAYRGSHILGNLHTLIMDSV